MGKPLTKDVTYTEAWESGQKGGEEATKNNLEVGLEIFAAQNEVLPGGADRKVGAGDGDGMDGRDADDQNEPGAKGGADRSLGGF